MILMPNKLIDGVYLHICFSWCLYHVYVVSGTKLAWASPTK